MFQNPQTNYMKKPILAFILISCLISNFSRLNAQDNVGIGTLTPNTKAILDLEATDKGFLAPRLSTANRLNIAPAATEAGLLVFDTDLSVYFYWDGTQWINFPGAGGLNTAFTFDNQTNTLSITDAGGTLSTILNIDINDADNDPTNELITSVVFGAGNILTIEEGGNIWATTINVNDADSDPTNELQDLSLNNNQLSISLTNSTVDLSPYINTDNQTLSLSGNTLSISNGNNVNLSGFANTDNQTLSLSGTTLSISGGNSVNLTPAIGIIDHWQWSRTGTQSATQTTTLRPYPQWFCALGGTWEGNGAGESCRVRVSGNNWVVDYKSQRSQFACHAQCVR